MIGTIWTMCGNCANVFSQPDDPGRKREYCDNRCRQQAYRARMKREKDSQQRQQRSEQRRERQQRPRPRRGSQGPAGMPDWCKRTYGDDAKTAKRRERAHALYERALHHGTGEHEADLSRVMADAMRARYGL